MAGVSVNRGIGFDQVFPGPLRDIGAEAPGRVGRVAGVRSANSHYETQLPGGAHRLGRDPYTSMAISTEAVRSRMDRGHSTTFQHRQRIPSRRLDPPHPYRGCSGASIQAVFPGVRSCQVGTGRIMAVDLRLDPPPEEPILAPRHDGARYSHFSQTDLVVEMLTLNTLHLHPERREESPALASYLAETVSGFSPASVDTYELTNVDPSLPKVVYGCQVVRDLIYGIPPGWQPASPERLMDGAVLPFQLPRLN